MKRKFIMILVEGSKAFDCNTIERAMKTIYHEIESVTEITDQPLVISEEVRKMVIDKAETHCKKGCSSCLYFNNKGLKDCHSKLIIDILATMQKAEPVGAVDVDEALNKIWRSFYNGLSSYEQSMMLKHYDNFKQNIRQLVQSNARPKIELPMVETGILMTASEVTRTDRVVNISYLIGKEISYLNNSDTDVNKRLEISKHFYPREFYKDIQTTVDYSKIPKNSIVKCSFEGKEEVGYFKRYGKDPNRDDKDFKGIVIGGYKNIDNQQLRYIQVSQYTIEIIAEGK